MSNSQKSIYRNLIDFIRQLVEVDKEVEGTSKLNSIWKKIRLWVMLAFGIALFAILLNQISISDFVATFTQVSIPFLIAAFLTGLSASVIRAIRFGLFFPPSGRWLGLYGIFALLRVLYYVLPFNSGEIVYLAALKKYRFTPSITEAAPTWFFLRLTDVIALSMWFIITLTFLPSSGTLFGAMYSYRWIIIGIASAVLVITLSFPFWIPKIKFSKMNNWFSQRFELLQSGFRRTFGITTLFKTLVVSICIWFVLILFDTFALLAFNTPLTFFECFLASIAVYCISLLPINAPLNLGTDEAIWTGVLMLGGVSTSLAVSIALSIRFISLLVIITEGLLGSSILILQKNSKAGLDFQAERL